MTGSYSSGQELVRSFHGPMLAARIMHGQVTAVIGFLSSRELAIPLPAFLAVLTVLLSITGLLN